MPRRVGRIKQRRRGDYWRPRRRSPFVHALRALLVILLTVLIVPPTAVGVAAVTYFMMPLPGSLPEERPQADSRRSIVVAADGSTIGEFRELETRVVVPSNQIPKVLRDAVIAVEDREFYAHKGIDVRGVARALWADVRSGKLEQGGSTITQQLVKNLYTSGERTLSRKLQEAILATQVERALSKDEIMARYLNTVYLGDSNFGVEAASQSYFRKPAVELTLAEAALLAGVIPAPSRYSPRQHPVEAEEKRQLVLDQMLDQGLASRQDVIEAKAQHPTIHPHPKVKGVFPYFLDYVRIYLLDVKGYSPDLIYRGGLRIETSLEPSLQEHAEKVVSSTLDLPEDPEASLVAVEPRSGFVRALVGGRSWDESKVNLGLGKLGGGSGRQAGSAFKPFVLARAFDLGIPPTKRYSAPASIQPRGFTKPVSNYEGGGYGSADLRKATWSSINTVFVQLILDVGVKETAEMAKRLGITSIDLDKPIYGGIAIGTQEVSPLDMASA
ncbi:MAG: transglycosylase domain-containing protein, partial [Acidimicrobiia bacterium]